MKATIFDGTTTRPFTPADKDAVSPKTPYAWIDVRLDGPDDPHLKPFLAGIGFSDVMTVFAARTDSSGMFQEVADNLVGATWAAADGTGAPVLVHFVWNSARLVTIRAGADRAMDTVYRQIEIRGSHLFARPSIIPGVVLELILESVARRLTELATELNDLDAAIIDAVDSAQLQQLRALRREIAPWTRRLPSYRDSVNEVLVDPTNLPGMDADGAQYLQAYYSHVQQTVARLGDVNDAVRSCAQDYQTEVGNKQGERINQLTVVSIVFLPISFLTGYFGMNFQWLVNVTESFASWLIFGAVVPVVIVVGSLAVLLRGNYGLRMPRPRSAREDEDPGEAGQTSPSATPPTSPPSAPSA